MKHRLNTDFNGQQNKGYTLIELLAVIFIVAVATAVYLPVANKYGIGAGIVAVFISILACVLIVVQFYRWSWRSEKQRLQELREKYQNVYRVNILPANERNLRKAVGAEIKIGDFGWEAGPLRKDGLIYLQGLTPEWYV